MNLATIRLDSSCDEPVVSLPLVRVLQEVGYLRTHHVQVVKLEEAQSEDEVQLILERATEKQLISWPENTVQNRVAARFWHLELDLKMFLALDFVLYLRVA